MVKYYGFNEYYARDLLQNKKRVPAMVKALNIEVNNRLVDNSMEQFKDITPKLFKDKAISYYMGDTDFVDTLQMPLVSYKQDKKFKGAFTADNPIKKTKQEKSSLVKKDTIGNDNVLDARKYYCLEIYKNNTNETCIRGIRYVDLKKVDKKLWLTCDYPEGYKEHLMYLFALDYIKIYNKKGELKFEGYYRSIHNIKQANLWFTYNNNNNMVPKTIGKSDIVTKYNVDILGKIGGEVKCSEPFMLFKERK